MAEVGKEAVRGKWTRKQIEDSLVGEHGFTLLDRVTTPQGDIWMAERFKTDNPEENPFGYYHGVYIVGQGENGMDIMHQIAFDAFHNPEIPAADKQRARRNKLYKCGLAALEAQFKAGRYK